MTMEPRDVIAFVSVLVALLGMVLVSRNARRATSVQSENADLVRIRELRIELRETKDELDHVKSQVERLSRRLDEANDAATTAYRDRAEMLRVARTPGMDLDNWLVRFDSRPPLTS